MSVVTIRGRLGSGAPEIGKLVADKLHADYVDREIIAEVAQLLNAQPRDVTAKEMPPGSFLGRIAEVLGSGYIVGAGYAASNDYAGAYLPTWQISLDDTRYLVGLESVIRGLARNQSIVISGRGSQFILKCHPGALHILVVASLDVRMKRTMESLKVDEESAKKEIEHSDSSRREFIKRYFRAEIWDPLNYDLILNAERLTFEDAASIIVDAVSFRKSPELKNG